MLDVLQYAIDEISTNYDRRAWWQQRVAHRLVSPLQSRLKNDVGVRVLDEDWDTLLVLDACRADLFEMVADTDSYDQYRRVYSAGSATNEWTKTNFDGSAETECVYVTGNPVVSRFMSTAFHSFVEPWRGGFDESSGTVPPKTVTEAALEARENHPEKRLVVHYLQPHYPFLGRPDLRYSKFNDADEVTKQGANPGAVHIWEALGEGLVDIETVWEAYAENLRRVLQALTPLIEDDRRTVITSDHGNMIGERLPLIPLQHYGHPPGVHHPALREVPWAVIAGENRSTGDERVDADVKKQLKSLGYAD